MDNQVETATERARSFDRAWDQMRPVTLERNVMKNADGSCLVTFGDTRVLCTAIVEEGVPRLATQFSRGLGHGLNMPCYLRRPTAAPSESAPTARVVPWRLSA